MVKFEVLGGDFDKGDGWIYHDGSFVFRKHNMIQRTIPHDHVREFGEATEASLVRLGLSRLLPDLRAARLDDPDIVLYFDDDRAVLIRADEKAREMIAHRVRRAYPSQSPQGHDDDLPDKPQDH